MKPRLGPAVRRAIEPEPWSPTPVAGVRHLGTQDGFEWAVADITASGKAAAIPSGWSVAPRDERTYLAAGTLASQAHARKQVRRVGSASQADRRLLWDNTNALAAQVIPGLQDVGGDQGRRSIQTPSGRRSFLRTGSMMRINAADTRPLMMPDARVGPSVRGQNPQSPQSPPAARGPHSGGRRLHLAEDERPGELFMRAFRPPVPPVSQLGAMYSATPYVPVDGPVDSYTELEARRSVEKRELVLQRLRAIHNSPKTRARLQSRHRNGDVAVAAHETAADIRRELVNLRQASVGVALAARRLVLGRSDLDAVYLPEDDNWAPTTVEGSQALRGSFPPPYVGALDTDCTGGGAAAAAAAAAVRTPTFMPVLRHKGRNYLLEMMYDASFLTQLMKLAEGPAPPGHGVGAIRGASSGHGTGVSAAARRGVVETDGSSVPTINLLPQGLVGERNPFLLMPADLELWWRGSGRPEEHSSRGATLGDKGEGGAEEEGQSAVDDGDNKEEEERRTAAFLSVLGGAEHISPAVAAEHVLQLTAAIATLVEAEERAWLDLVGVEVRQPPPSQDEEEAAAKKKKKKKHQSLASFGHKGHVERGSYEEEEEEQEVATPAPAEEKFESQMMHPETVALIGHAQRVRAVAVRKWRFDNTDEGKRAAVDGAAEAARLRALEEAEAARLAAEAAAAAAEAARLLALEEEEAAAKKKKKKHQSLASFGHKGHVQRGSHEEDHEEGQEVATPAPASQSDSC